jgi:CRP/FNR family cyclic AMP-dependent transcriptional regulator
VSGAVARRVAAHPFLSGLTDAQRATLAGDGSAVRFAGGSRIFEEGGIADRFWLVDSGRIALDMRVPGRGEQVVETLGGRTVLGWSWLTPPYRWHFGAIAREDSEAVVFNAASVRRRCQNDPALGFAILTCFTPVIVDRLQATRVRLLDLYGQPGRAAR